MKALYDTAFIMSAELATLSKAENKERTEELETRLATMGAAFKRVDGVFNNKAEISFVIQGISASNLQFLLIEYDQACALKLDNDRHVSFVSPNGKVEPAGKFTAVAESVAKAQANYTFDPETKQFFIITK